MLKKEVLLLAPKIENLDIRKRLSYEGRFFMSKIYKVETIMNRYNLNCDK